MTARTDADIAQYERDVLALLRAKPLADFVLITIVPNAPFGMLDVDVLALEGHPDIYLVVAEAAMQMHVSQLDAVEQAFVKPRMAQALALLHQPQWLDG